MSHSTVSSERGREADSACAVIESDFADEYKDEKGHKFVNNYLLLEKLGRGSYSQVRLCEDQQSKKQYALKICNRRMLRKTRALRTLTDGSSEIISAWDKVMQEVSILKSINNPHIARLYEVIDDPESDYLYMVQENAGTPIMQWNPNENPNEDDLGFSPSSSDSSPGFCVPCNFGAILDALSARLGNSKTTGSSIKLSSSTKSATSASPLSLPSSSTSHNPACNTTSLASNSSPLGSSNFAHPSQTNSHQPSCSSRSSSQRFSSLAPPPPTQLSPSNLTTPSTPNPHPHSPSSPCIPCPIPNAYPEWAARLIFKDILRAVEYLHSRNIVHGDIKPDNVLISPLTGTVKLVDFTVSTVLSSPNQRIYDCETSCLFVPPEVLTPEFSPAPPAPPPASTSTPCSTSSPTNASASSSLSITSLSPSSTSTTTTQSTSSSSSSSVSSNDPTISSSFPSSSSSASSFLSCSPSSPMLTSPLQSASSPLASPLGSGFAPFPSEIWSLGILLYLLVCGRTPYFGLSQMEILHQIRSSPLKFPAHLSPEVKDLISKLLCKDPSARIQAQAVWQHAWFK
eukprot:GILI01008625.1.p1 GENE.GILI01008625.1~~GILI01008625.1.p1  ORF type:complete len:570 (+),score=96.26 GILI01008625.1:118-1827(+)